METTENRMSIRGEIRNPAQSTGLSTHRAHDRNVDKTGRSEKTTPQRGEAEVYGWEEDLPFIWMRHFNRELLRAGIISREEYIAIDRRIQPCESRNKESRRKGLNQA